MIDCVAVGDSIALGVGITMNCEIKAQVGLSSKSIISFADGTKAELCVISAGSNDPLNDKLIINLKKIRNSVNCEKVVWINPIHTKASHSVSVSKNIGDYVISFTPSRDNVHPVNYKLLSQNIFELVK